MLVSFAAAGWPWQTNPKLSPRAEPAPRLAPGIQAVPLTQYYTQGSAAGPAGHKHQSKKVVTLASLCSHSKSFLTLVLTGRAGPVQTLAKEARM